MLVDGGEALVKRTRCWNSTCELAVGEGINWESIGVVTLIRFSSLGESELSNLMVSKGKIQVRLK